MDVMNRNPRILDAGPIPDCSGSPADEPGRNRPIHLGQQSGDFAIARSHDSGYLRREEFSSPKNHFGKRARDQSPESEDSSNRTRRAAAAEQEHSARPQKPGDFESDHPAERGSADKGRMKSGHIGRQSSRVVGKTL
jgi:hypothetical protein